MGLGAALLVAAMGARCAGEGGPSAGGTGGSNPVAGGGAPAAGITGGAEHAGGGGSSGTGSRPATAGQAGSSAGAETTGGDLDSPPQSAGALSALSAYLEAPRESRPDLETQAFAAMPLSRQDAAQAAQLLWDDFAAFVRETRASEVGATAARPASLQARGSTLRYYQAVRGAEPPGGRSLFISMHGGGNAPAATNDQQWGNQIALVDGYMPQDAIWVAPRAPSNDWNMWFTPDIEPLFERLITDMIVFEGINPNKVYLTGYSAGGDGVYQLGPRMADHWAGAAMSAGHPNDASPESLRNVAFAIHAGGNDTAYDRNLKAAEWGGLLEALAAEDGAGGYPHQWQVHAGLPHWMNLADAVAIPFLQMHTRNPVPSKVVWHQANVTHTRFYWLAVDPADALPETRVTATYAENTVALSDVVQLRRITIRLSDAMMDLDQPVRVELAGRELFYGPVERTIAVLDRTLANRGDPTMVYAGEVTVDLQ